MYPVPTQLICSITPILTIGYITFLRGNLGLAVRDLGFLSTQEKETAEKTQPQNIEQANFEGRIRRRWSLWVAKVSLSNGAARLGSY